MPAFLLLVIFAAIDPVFGVILVAIIGPTSAYLVAAHKMSGKIATTEATDLWAESRAIREWSADRLDACDKEISELRVALSAALSRVTVLEDENAKLLSRIRGLEREAHALREEAQ